MVNRLKLAKTPLCVLIGVSTFFGFILAQPLSVVSGVAVATSICLLSMGGATCNSLQELHLDSLMTRTSPRPLVTGVISRNQAFVQAILLCTFAIFLLSVTCRDLSVVLAAVTALLLYNGIYTPLKKKTVWAIIPGGLCGAIPPVIGWMAGGGAIYDYYAILIFTLFFLWQIPHFWLVMLRYKEDYLKRIVPSLLEQLQEPAIKRASITWIGAMVVVMLLFINAPFYLSPVFCTLIIVNGLILLTIFLFIMFGGGENRYRKLFMVLNGSLLAHMIIVGCGRVYS